MADGMHASCLDTFMVLLQALPASLRVLHASTAPVELLAQLTALESLTLENRFSHAASATCSLSMLQRLTMLQLGRAKAAELDMIGACAGLRTLCLHGASFNRRSVLLYTSTSCLDLEHAVLPCKHNARPVACLHIATTLYYITVLDLDEGETPLPLQCPQLTRLQLCSGEYDWDHVLAMTLELGQLETLEVPKIEDIDEVTATALARLPQLRTVNVSHSPLCAPGQETKSAGKPLWVPICECMASEVVERLLRLRQAAPHIDWVVAGMGCCDEEP